MKHVLLGLTPLVTIPFLFFLNFLSGKIVNGTSKGDFSQRYYSIQSTNQRLDRFDYVVTAVMRLVLTTVFSVLTAMAGLVIVYAYCSNDKFENVLNCADTLLKEVFDFVGPITLAVIALVAFWGTYNKKECLFYQIEDIYKEKKLQDKLVDALFCYCFTFILKTITTVLPKSEVQDLQIAKFLLFVTAIALCLYGVFRSLGAIVATTEMIFNPNDSMKLLNCLHLRVRQERKNLSM